MASKDKYIPYAKQSIDSADIENVRKALRSDFLTTGPLISEFERRLCELTGAKYAVVCSNGTVALHLAVLALGIGKNDLGITSPITFLSSANCVEFCGGRIDFVDISSDSLCLSINELNNYCIKKEVPKVVIPVDFTGVPSDLPRIWELAKKYGFKVIEDAAHAIGSTYVHEGIEYQCGGCYHSDLAIFSFHPVKAITAGEGGAVLTNDPKLASLAKQFRNHGMTKDLNILIRNEGDWYYEMHELGYNYRITDIQCALGISQLEKLDLVKNRRQEIVRRYNKAFSNINKVILPPWPENTSPCFHLYVIQFKEGPDKRKQIYNKLRQDNILTQVHYIPVYWQPYFMKKYGYEYGKCVISEKFYSRCLSLPLYSSMSDDDISYVIKSVYKYLNN